MIVTVEPATISASTIGMLVSPISAAAPEVSPTRRDAAAAARATTTVTTDSIHHSAP
nr:hypothetical protein [Amnibacterium kyonggiense]